MIKSLYAGRSQPDKGYIYGLTETPAATGRLQDNAPLYRVGEREAKWSGGNTPPAIGDRVKVTMNNLGTGVVVAYFIEANWLGVEVDPDPGQRPEWHVKQNGANSHYLVFGAEIKLP